MYDELWHEQAAKTARILQIIVGAMAAGASVFLVVVLTIGSQAKPLILPIPLAWLVVPFVGGELVARAVVLWNIARKGRREIINGTYQPVDPRQRIGSPPADIADTPPDPYRDAKYLLSVFQQGTIVSAALFEGCAFFATIAYLIEGNPLSLGLAVLLVLAVAAHFPTQSRAIAWVERQLERLQEEKVMQ
jgi:hypothetical protein